MSRVFGNHHGDGLAHVAHPAAGQHRPRIAMHARRHGSLSWFSISGRSVAAKAPITPASLAPRRGGRLQLGMRIVRPDHGHMQHPGNWRSATYCPCPSSSGRSSRRRSDLPITDTTRPMLPTPTRGWQRWPPEVAPNGVCRAFVPAWNTWAPPTQSFSTLQSFGTGSSPMLNGPRRNHGRACAALSAGERPPVAGHPDRTAAHAGKRNGIGTASVCRELTRLRFGRLRKHAHQLTGVGASHPACCVQLSSRRGAVACGVTWSQLSSRGGVTGRSCPAGAGAWPAARTRLLAEISGLI